jgi:hypothetical protein
MERGAIPIRITEMDLNFLEFETGATPVPRSESRPAA